MARNRPPEESTKSEGNVSWLLDRGGVMCRFDHIDPRRTALLVVDMQDAFVNPQYGISAAGTRGIIAAINRIGRSLRDHGGRVAFTRHTTSDEAPYALPTWLRETRIIQQSEGLFRPGTASHGLHDLLETRPDDIIVNKHRYSAFLPNSSTLHAELRLAGIDTLIITGTVTNACCESSARDASMLDYRVLFVSDANSAVTREAHEATLRNLSGIFADVRDTQEIIDIIERSAAARSRDVTVDTDRRAPPSPPAV